MQVLGAEDVEALLKHLPSAAEIAALIGPASPPCSGQTKLDKRRNTADRYLRLMAEIPRVHDRLALMLGCVAVIILAGMFAAKDTLISVSHTVVRCFWRQPG